jgi:hypothetical protein
MAVIATISEKQFCPAASARIQLRASLSSWEHPCPAESAPVQLRVPLSSWEYPCLAEYPFVCYLPTLSIRRRSVREHQQTMLTARRAARRRGRARSLTSEGGSPWLTCQSIPPWDREMEIGRGVSPFSVSNFSERWILRERSDWLLPYRYRRAKISRRRDTSTPPLLPKHDNHNTCELGSHQTTIRKTF